MLVKRQAFISFPPSFTEALFTEVPRHHAWTWTLSGIIAHRAPGHSGHCIYRHRGEDHWIEFNDEKVRDLPEGGPPMTEILSDVSGRATWTPHILADSVNE